MLRIGDYYNTRAVQICIVFTCSQLLEAYFHFTRAGWIGFAVMMIYAGFDSGASIHRSKHRFWGAVLGLLLSYFLFIIIRFNDDFIWLIVPIILFMAYFTVSKLYVTPTIFTVSLTGLGADYYQSESFAVQSFFEEYLFSTLIAYLLCVVLEYYVFKRADLSNKFYLESQEKIVNNLDNLFAKLSTQTINSSKFLKLTAELDEQLIRLGTFIRTSRHNYSMHRAFYKASKQFNLQAEQVYKHLHTLYIEKDKQQASLLTETASLLKDLRASID